MDHNPPTDPPLTEEEPEGFVPATHGGPYAADLGPFWSHRAADYTALGIRVAHRHSNSMGGAHGGFVATLADLGLVHAVAVAREKAGLPRAALATVNLSIDFLGRPLEGTWMECRAEVSRLGRTMAFTEGTIFADDKRVAPRQRGVHDAGTPGVTDELPQDWPQPLDGAVVPRFAAPATFMRLPLRADASGLDIALLGVPFDGGTTNRPGARHGPRQMREMSAMLRRVHPVTRVEPYALCRVADVGDVNANPMDLMGSLAAIEARVAELRAGGAWTLAAGGDHLDLAAHPARHPPRRAGLPLGLPPLGLVHFDAHSDTNDSYFGGSRFTHGTPFRRAIEEGLLDPRRIVQIGIRGSLFDPRRTWHGRARPACGSSPSRNATTLGPDGVVAEARRVVGDRTRPT